MYKIMIADDEGIVIDALKFIIEKSFGETCQVRSAKTGRSVIELAESFRPDIALMDIQMPGINGIEAMKEIRKTNKDIIFIVITAYDKFDYAREAVGLGVMEYVNKPIDRVKITRLLEQAMERINGERERRSNDLRVKGNGDTDCGKRLHLLRAVSAKLRPGSFSVQRSAGGYGGQRLHDGH